MGRIRALLIGVCTYPANRYTPLPFCMNDIFAVKSALINGLHTAESDIKLCGTADHVSSVELLAALVDVLATATKDDTFLFYFSGHGGKNSLALSDGNIPLQTMIEIIEKTITKNKIIILDSCHSGDFSVRDTPALDLSDTIDNFAGHGYAVLASCGSEQKSGFNDERKISIYTGFLVDALTSRFLIKRGRKSLEEINEAIFQFAKAWNRNNHSKVQEPVFRSNIGGTIYFDIEEYNPYRVAEIYEETEKYIIYEVKPLHTGMAKRLAAKVILRFDNSFEEIAIIAEEIKDKLLFSEIYQNAKSEARHTGKPANIVWCYFGYSEDDIIDANYICHTTWIDDKQDKSWWYRETKNSNIICGVYFEINSSYKMMQHLLHDTIVGKDELIAMTHTLTEAIITAAEKFIKQYREYRNNTITEKQLIDNVAPLNREISVLFIKQSNLPYPPKELNNWANAHTQIAGTIQDFSLYYDKRNLDKWTTENRIYLMDTSIKRYEADLEALREVEKTV